MECSFNKNCEEKYGVFIQYIDQIHKGKQKNKQLKPWRGIHLSDNQKFEFKMKREKETSPTLQQNMFVWNIIVTRAFY